MLTAMTVEGNRVLRWRVDGEVHVRYGLEKKGMKIGAGLVAFTREF